MADDDNIDELSASSSLGNQASDVASTSKASGDFMDEYSDALQHELQRSSLAKSFATAEKDEPDEVVYHSSAFLNHDALITSNQRQLSSCFLEKEASWIHRI